MADVPPTTLIRRETRALVLLPVIAVAAFLVTRTVAHANQARRQRDAQAWFVRGDEALRRGDAAVAARHLRRAAALDPPNLRFRLELASALIAADGTEEARRVLQEARVAAPWSADVQLALGRLEAKDGDTGAAIIGYQAALNELWRPTDAASRFQVRAELARYLLTHDERSRALSELLIVSADMPDTAAAHADVGGMFLEAGEPARAVAQLERSLTLDPKNQLVRLAAGQAAFALGDDSRALRHLRAASQLAPAQDLASTITLALSHDPLLPRLSAVERERRLRAGLLQARTRLDDCAAGTDRIGHPLSSPLREQLDRFQSSLTSASGRRGVPVVDVLDDGVELIGRVEAETAACGAPTALDRALILIGHRHEARP